MFESISAKTTALVKEYFLVLEGMFVSCRAESSYRSDRRVSRPERNIWIRLPGACNASRSDLSRPKRNIWIGNLTVRRDCTEVLSRPERNIWISCPAQLRRGGNRFPDLKGIFESMGVHSSDTLRSCVSRPKRNIWIRERRAVLLSERLVSRPKRNIWIMSLRTLRLVKKIHVSRPKRNIWIGDISQSDFDEQLFPDLKGIFESLRLEDGGHRRQPFPDLKGIFESRLDNNHKRPNFVSRPKRNIWIGCTYARSSA